jgi:hypothetical protein
MENYTIDFLLITSTILMLGGIVYGFKNMKLIRLNKLWTTAWIFFVLMLVIVLVRRSIAYEFDITNKTLEQSIVVVSSFSFFFFSYLINKFFRKYLNNGQKNRGR